MSNIMDGCSATFDEMSKLLDEQNDGYVKSTGFGILSLSYRAGTCHISGLLFFL